MKAGSPRLAKEEGKRGREEEAEQERERERERLRCREEDKDVFKRSDDCIQSMLGIHGTLMS